MGLTTSAAARPSGPAVRWAGLAGAVVVAVLYAYGVSYAPIYLHHDEVVNALNAHDIVTSGRDVNGRLFPLYFSIGGDYWATPVVAYTTAIALTVLPLSETTIRMVSVAVGLTGLVLTYAVARRLFSRELALLAAALLALTPAYFMHSRVAFDQIYPLPFVLGWLWCLLVFLDERRPRLLAIGGLLLGIGLYTYLGSLIMMPVYGLVTWVVLYTAGERSPRVYVAALTAFVAPALLLIPWHLAHPTQLEQQMHMYSMYDPESSSAWQGLRALVSYTSLTDRANVFHQGFNPSMLFFSGGSSLINGTSRVGALLLPIAVLLPAGIYRVCSRRMSPQTFALLLGLATAPLAGTVVGEVTINRLLHILPFAILLSVFGVEQFLESSRVTGRWAGVLLLLLVPAQFGVFYADYMGDYRLRSRHWFERNIRGAVEAVIAEDVRSPVPAVYISPQEIPFIDTFWRYFLTTHDRADLLARTVQFSASEVDPGTMPPGAVVLANSEGRLRDAMLAAGLRETQVIREPTGDASFSLLVR